MRAYEQFAQLAADAGVRAVFGVMGDGNMHWIARFRELPGCQWFPAWHESGAVWMADGWARAHQRTGVATVTMGPGLAQALPALMTAARARTPLMLVTAALPARTPPLAQYAAQRELVTAAGASYVEVAKPDRLAVGLDAALASARGGVPAVLAVHLDVFESGDAQQLPPRREAPPAPRPGAAVLDLAAERLARASAPVVLLGGGVRAADCVGTALRLGRRIGAAFGTTVGGRVALPDEPWDLGVLGMMANPVARRVADSADLLLVLGCALDRYNSDDGRLGAGKQIVRVDLRRPEQLWSPSPDTLDITGDLQDVLPELAARLTDHRAAGTRTDTLRSALESERSRQHTLADAPALDGPNPWAVVRELNESLPPDAHVVVGIGHFWYFVAPHLRPEPRRTFHFACGFASIGQAVPAAIGAALASTGRPVVAVEGDGSAVMNLQELQAAVRHGADLLVVILDNQAYASEYHKLRLAGLDPHAATFENTPFDVAAVASAMGATARTAHDPGELSAALRELAPARGVRLVVARISPSVMSEVYARLHGAPAAAAAGASHPAAWDAPAASSEPPR